MEKLVGYGETKPETGTIVTITVGVNEANKEVNIHRGRRSVVEIKTAAGVPPEYVIDQIIDGEIKPLQNNDSVTIKGGERFISHPDDGKAS